MSSSVAQGGDLDVPFLGKQPRGPEVAEVMHVVHEAWAATKEYWAQSIDADYLASPFSRRGSLTYSFLIMASWGSTHHIIFSDQWSFVVLDCAYILVSVALLRLVPRHSLLMDVLVVASIVMYTHLCERSHDGVVQRCRFGIESGASLLMLIYASLGIHSCVCWLGLVSLSVLNWGVVQWSVLITDLAFAGLALLAIGILWTRLSFCMFALQKAQQRLVENASDGSCSVEMASGRITAACSRFSGLFEAASMEGRLLQDILDPHGRDVLRSLVNSAAMGEFEPRLVTCELRGLGRTLKMKLVPYRVISNTLQLCVQVRGEARPPLPEGMAVSIKRWTVAAERAGNVVASASHVGYPVSNARSTPERGSLKPSTSATLSAGPGEEAPKHGIRTPSPNDSRSAESSSSSAASSVARPSEQGKRYHSRPPRPRKPRRSVSDSSSPHGSSQRSCSPGPRSPPPDSGTITADVESRVVEAGVGSQRPPTPTSDVGMVAPDVKPHHDKDRVEELRAAVGREPGLLIMSSMASSGLSLKMLSGTTACCPCHASVAAASLLIRCAFREPFCPLGRASQGSLCEVCACKIQETTQCYEGTGPTIRNDVGVGGGAVESGTIDRPRVRHGLQRSSTNPEQLRYAWEKMSVDQGNFPDHVLQWCFEHHSSRGGRVRL
mmetsp:Transcript_82058/g.228705  ORF Transcript_82058/g.228705 Transcript_82058/m.228705 type:complete len:665 (-) Transcript_82058:134-2128(-)